MKVCHLADIHWRGGVSRHSEFKDVFERCFSQMRDLKPDLIYVGGDIVHSKTQGISPELIDHLVWWFKSLADIAPTHVILGNHDGIMLNSDRQDAISPVISALSDPRIFLYKKSGTYPTGIPGFNWCVFSCFDESGWTSVHPTRGDVNIALFHGPVWGSRTDIDWQIEGEINTSFFDRFDFAMLGDIHRMQFLTDDRRIAYSGSTMQHDHGDALEKGFLFWDIRSRDDFDVTFHQVAGRHPFVTVDWKGSVTDTVSSLRNLPGSARIRVRSDEPIPDVEWRQLRRELDQVISPSEVVSKTDRDYDVQRFTTNDVTLAKDDLRTGDVQVRLLRQYYGDSNLAPEVWQDVEGKLRELLSEAVKSDEFTRGSRWSLRKIEFDNTFSYGPGNVIDFTKMPGITGIFGRNACGKSSIVGTLMYALFNATDRGSVKNLHVVNVRKDHCVTRATVDVDGEIMRFDRQTVKHLERDGSGGALTHLNIFRVDESGTILEDHSREQRRVSENVIRGRLGIAEDFLLTTLASQGEMNNFVEKKNTARKAVLSRFLGLDVFDRMVDSLKDEGKMVQAQMKSMPDRDWDTLLSEILTEQVSVREGLERADKILSSLREEETSLKVKLHSVKACEVTHAQVVDQRHLVTNLVRKCQDAQRKCEILTKDLEIARGEYEAASIKQDSVDLDEARNRLKHVRNLEKALVDLEHTYDRELSMLTLQQKSVDRLLEVPCGDKFPTCKFIKDSHENKGKVDAQKEKVSDLLAKVRFAKSDLELAGSSHLLEKVIREQEGFSVKLTSLELEVAKRSMSVHQHQVAAEKIDSERKIAQERLAQMEEVVRADGDSVEIKKIRERIAEVTSRVSDVDGKKVKLAARSGSLEANRRKLEEEKVRYQETKRRWNVIDVLLQALSRKGIPLQIVTSQLPIINAEVAKILQGVVNFVVELQVDEGSNDLEVFISYGDSRRIIEVASGMEKMIASLAIRVALINVSSLPKTDMLIIDEGFGTLDDLNVEACNRMLVSLKRWFKNILIISHVDGVKDVVDNVIDITKVGPDSRVVSE